MIFPTISISIITANLLATSLAPGADAHGYLLTPRSRNYRAHVDGKWSGGTASTPAVEAEPQSLNIGGSEARCGVVGGRNYDYPRNALNGNLVEVAQECYEEGAIINIESVLTAHHMGHFEVKACPITTGEVATQECFNANPLTFVSDNFYNAPVDPLYPGRAYIPRSEYSTQKSSSNAYLFRHQFKLPDGLKGELVLLQWYYLTGNSCLPEGYTTYAFPEGFHPGSQLPACGPIPSDGRGVPEQFWNCAEVAVKVGCDGSTPTPPAPTPAIPTASPTTLPTSTQVGGTPTLAPMIAQPSSSKPTSQPTTSKPTTATATSPSCQACPSGATGLYSTDGCLAFRNCLDGVDKGINSCAAGLLFDEVGGYCNWADQVTCKCQTSSVIGGPTASPSQKPTSNPSNNPTTSKPSTMPTHTPTVQTTTSKPTTATATSPSCLACPSGATGLYSTDNCRAFRNCLDGVDKGVSACGAGTVFDEARGYCNWPDQVTCKCQTSSVVGGPTASPTLKPTSNPTLMATSSKPTTTSPTSAGIVAPTTSKPSTAKPTTSKPTTSSAGPLPTSSPTTASPPTSSAAAAVEAVLEANKDGIDNKVLLYQTPQMQWVPSTVYRYQDLLDGLRVMYNDGVANKYFFMGDDSPNGYRYGLVNIAAFLAQSMKETIQYNACDENSWDLVNGKYPLSNACGQLGQSYQDYQCSAAEAHMACTVNPNMEIKATTNAKWYGAPGPLFCGPKAKFPFTGIWDYTKECNKPWANPPEFCNEYEGQKAGGYDNTSPQANSLGRTDVEGCCFWGRGVIQTTGVCNFGKLNYYLGQRAADEGRASRYPDINFCEQPNAICDSEEHKELKWIAGMFYWVEELQSYNVGGWNYITELKKFVDGGMQDGNNFINAVSGIVNRGCHNPPCAAGPVDGESDRSSNFLKVMKEFKLVV